MACVACARPMRQKRRSLRRSRPRRGRAGVEASRRRRGPARHRHRISRGGRRRALEVRVGGGLRRVPTKGSRARRGPARVEAESTNAAALTTLGLLELPRQRTSALVTLKSATLGGFVNKGAGGRLGRRAGGVGSASLHARRVAEEQSRLRLSAGEISMRRSNVTARRSRRRRRRTRLLRSGMLLE